MSKFYSLGSEQALRTLGLEKVAFNGADLIRTISGAGGMGAIGSMGRQALTHGGAGALLGGAAGAVGADERHRGSGFMRGALTGGAMGAAGGALAHGFASKGLRANGLLGEMATRPSRFYASNAGRVPQLEGMMGRAGNAAAGASLGGLGAAAIGGGLAGSTAQQSPMEKLKARFGGMFG